MRALGDVARDPPRGRPLPGAPGRRLRPGGRGRPPAARLGLLAGRPPDRAWRVAARRPVLVPARGRGAAEPPGLAARRPVLAARSRLRGRLGLRPRRPPLVRPGRRIRLLVAARARALRAGGARGRRGLLPDALPRRPVDRAPPRADRVPPSGDAARPRAPALRARRRGAGSAPALGPAPPGARRDPPRARVCVGEAAARRLVEGGRRGGRGDRSGAGRRPLGGRRVDRDRALVRAGRAVLGRGLRFRHALGGVGRRGARVRRLGDAARRARRPRRRPQPAGPRDAPGARRAAPLPLRARAPTCRATRPCGGGSRASTRRACPSASCRSPASRWPPWRRSASSA